MDICGDRIQKRNGWQLPWKTESGMTQTEACKILALPPGASKEDIKKRYRQLMQQVHPDVGESVQKAYAYSAQEINLAYGVLIRGRAPGGQGGGDRKPGGTTGKTAGKWDAPVNENAYAEREVLQFAEDCEGAVLGEFRAAYGKYLWTTEEDFSLFLRSVAGCGRRILEEVDEHLQKGGQSVLRQQVLAELVYLLAQQFMDKTALLQELAGKETTDLKGNSTFYFSAMVELTGRTVPQEGETLYPAAIRQHRLYLKNQAEQELGYLSFPDDRLYYVIIPLLEQRKARVRIRVAKMPERGKQKRMSGYRKLHLWIMLSGDGQVKEPENLNLSIDRLLEKYKKA